MAKLTKQDFQSQFTLSVTTGCSLSCYFCPLWQKEMFIQAKSPLAELCKSPFESTFFNRYPWKRLYNIVGGEPTMFPELIRLLQFLKKSGVKIRLWTHGCLSETDLEALMPWVDFFAVYLICPDESLFREMTGYPRLDEVNYTLNRLKEAKHPRMLHMPLRPELIEWLPDLREFAFKTSTYLYLHAYKYQAFSKDQLEHIRYFDKIPNVTVKFYGKQNPEHLCAALPYWEMPEALPSLKKRILATIFGRQG